MRIIALFLLLLACAPAQTTFEDTAKRAAAARQARDIVASVQLYQKAVALNPKWAEGWWSLGTLAYEAGQYDAARDALKRLVALTPKSGAAWALLSLSEFETAEYPKSLDHLRRSLTFGAGNDPHAGELLHYHEPLLLIRTGDFDAALRKYMPAVRTGKPDPELIVGLGLAALRRPWVPTEVPEDQRDLIFTAGRAQLFMMAEQPKDADEVFQDLLRRYPTALNVHRMYGFFLYQSFPERAIEEMKRELQLNPSNASAATVLALALLTNGDVAAALPYALQGVQGDPSAMAHYVLGRTLVESGKLDTGIKELESAIAMSPDHLDSHVSLAVAYPKLGRYMEAKRERVYCLKLREDMDRAHR